MKIHGNKIVLDLEFTPVRDPDLQAVASSEILEIGAVKLNENNEVMEEFQTYVKPQYSSIPPHITRITGITEKTVENAPSYGAAVAAFTDWVGDSVRSRFYTWSNSDQGVLLKEADLKEQTLHKMFYTYWVDLQRIHQRLYGFTRPMNLTSALADARNTAGILQQLSHVQAVRQQIEASHITYNSTESHGFTMGLVFKNR